jgi:hypothetical protein
MRAATSPGIVIGNLSVAIYCLVGLGFMFQGIRYLVAAELMPYHLEVLALPWAEVDASFRQLFLGLLKGFGAGSLTVGLAVVLLALSALRSRTRWALWLTPAISGTYAGALVYVTNYALLPGAIPITVSVTLLVLVALAAFGSLWIPGPE